MGETRAVPPVEDFVGPRSATPPEVDAHAYSPCGAGGLWSRTRTTHPKALGHEIAQAQALVPHETLRATCHRPVRTMRLQGKIMMRSDIFSSAVGNESELNTRLHWTM